MTLEKISLQTHHFFGFYMLSFYNFYMLLAQFAASLLILRCLFGRGTLKALTENEPSKKDLNSESFTQFKALHFNKLASTSPLTQNTPRWCSLHDTGSHGRRGRGTFLGTKHHDLRCWCLTIDRSRRAMGRKRLQQNASGGKLSLERELAGVKGGFYVEKKELFGYMQHIRVHTTYVIYFMTFLDHAVMQPSHQNSAHIFR